MECERVCVQRTISTGTLLCARTWGSRAHDQRGQGTVAVRTHDKQVKFCRCRPPLPIIPPTDHFQNALGVTPWRSRNLQTGFITLSPLVGVVLVHHFLPTAARARGGRAAWTVITL